MKYYVLQTLDANFVVKGSVGIYTGSFTIFSEAFVCLFNAFVFC